MVRRNARCLGKEQVYRRLKFRVSLSSVAFSRRYTATIATMDVERERERKDDGVASLIEDRGAYQTSSEALRPLKIHLESQPSGVAPASDSVYEKSGVGRPRRPISRYCENRGPKLFK